MVKKPPLELDNKLMENFCWSWITFQLFNITSFSNFFYKTCNFSQFFNFFVIF